MIVYFVSVGGISAGMIQCEISAAIASTMAMISLGSMGVNGKAVHLLLLMLYIIIKITCIVHWSVNIISDGVY